MRSIHGNHWEPDGNTQHQSPTSHSQEIDLLASQSLSPFFHHQNIFIAKSAADSEMNAISCKKQMHVISSKLNWVHYRFRKSYDAFEYLTRNHTVLTWFTNATRQPAIRENLLTQTPSTDLIRLQLGNAKWWHCPLCTCCCSPAQISSKVQDQTNWWGLHETLVLVNVVYTKNNWWVLHEA